MSSKKKKYATGDIIQEKRNQFFRSFLNEPARNQLLYLIKDIENKNDLYFPEKIYYPLALNEYYNALQLLECRRIIQYMAGEDYSTYKSYSYEHSHTLYHVLTDGPEPWCIYIDYKSGGYCCFLVRKTIYEMKNSREKPVEMPSMALIELAEDLKIDYCKDEMPVKFN